MKHRENASCEAPTDEALALRAADGCLLSFEQLAVRFQVPLLGYLRHRCKSQEDAEDLVQEAMLRAYRNIHRYKSEWRFSTWLFTIAHRLAINAFRRQGRTAPVTDSEVSLVAAESRERDPADEVQRTDDGQRLWAIAAAELGEPKFTALWLYYGEGMPVNEVAEVLEKSPGAIKTILLRARRQLLPTLREQWGDREGTSAGTESEANPTATNNSRDKENSGVSP